jgi:ketosteroid isomerase-like protein
MPITKSEINAFYADYAVALASRDAKAIAGFWGVPALVLGDEGVIAVGKAAETEAFFASSMEQYKNVVSASARIAHTAHLADSVVGCEIVWEHRDAAGTPIGGEAGHYMLKRGESGLRIHVYTPKPLA